MVTDNERKIETLLELTNDPVQRATLIVLQRIDNALEDNTAAMQAIADSFNQHQKEFASHRKEFTKHSHDEEKIFAGLKGGWYASLALVGIVQALVVFFITSQVRTNEAQDLRLLAVEHRLVEVSAAVTTRAKGDK